jgi:hypothetical protein
MSNPILYQYISLLSCGLFTGASIYINTVEHPSRMEVGVKYTSTVFPGAYRRGAIMQAGLAIICFVFSILAFLNGASAFWLYAGVIQFSVVPFTFLVIMPVNKQLLDPNMDRDSPHTKKLFETWGKLHGMRSVASSVAFLLFLNQLLPVVKM